VVNFKNIQMKSATRETLHHWIDSLADEDLPLINAIMEAESSHVTKISAVQLHELEERRARFLRGEGQNYTPQQAIAMARELGSDINGQL
jgi:hypothetical protein